MSVAHKVVYIFVGYINNRIIEKVRLLLDIIKICSAPKMFDRVCRAHFRLHTFDKILLFYSNIKLEKLEVNERCQE